MRINVDRLIKILDTHLRVGLEKAASLAALNKHSTVEIAHWLRALLDDGDVYAKLSELVSNIHQLQDELDETINDLPQQEGGALTLSQNLIALLREAWTVASLQFGRKRVSIWDLLIALTTEASLQIISRVISPSLRSINDLTLENQVKNIAETCMDIPIIAGQQTGMVGKSEFLSLYTTDLTSEARAGRIDPVIGRDRELRQLIDVLMRRRQNNPILVGEAGVGKTAVAEALAMAIVSGNVPRILQSVRLLALDLSLLQAGAAIKGEFERRVHGVVDAVKASSQPIILFIDEAHCLVGAGGQAGQGVVANILKPALARGELRTIAATTWSEYKRFFEKDAALTRRFQLVKVEEPDEETAIRMLRGVAGIFSAHHGVRIRENALAAAVRLSARYMPSRQLPDKAISLIDTAAASVALARQTLPEAMGALRNELLLLEVEASRLSEEPLSKANHARITEIVSSRTELQCQIEQMECRFSEEVALVEEADRLEARCLSTQPDWPHSAGNVCGVTNTNMIAEVPDLCQQSDLSDLADLAVISAKLTEKAGDNPLVPRVVDRESVAAVVARWTGIPVGKLLSDQAEAVKTLEERLKMRVVGQNGALNQIACAVRIAQAGLADPQRPPAILLFVGMSGTGKTETAHALADLLYGSSRSLTTINMSEFKEEHKISMLLGSPPGYVGYGEGGVLTEAVRRRPYGIVLLDEIDKAHPGVQDIFYQVFDKGTLRDGEGRDIDFKNTLIIMTANVGAERLAALQEDNETLLRQDDLEALLLPELQQVWKPAFLGRLMVVPFIPLTKDALNSIVDMQIRRIKDRVQAVYGVQMLLEERAREALVSRAKSSETGARTIEAMIARDLMPCLSAFFLDALIDARPTSDVTIGFEKGHFQIEVSYAPKKSAIDPAGNQKPDEASLYPLTAMACSILKS